MHCRERDGNTSHQRDGEGWCAGIGEARKVMAFVRLAYLFRKKIISHQVLMNHKPTAQTNGFIDHYVLALFHPVFA